MTDILIDTHVFLWWQTGNQGLGPNALKSLTAPSNRIFVSAASIGEIAIKARKGKLIAKGSPAAAVAANGFYELPILAIEAEAAGNLHWVHADPFDRLLVAQSIRLSLLFMTADDAIRRFRGVSQLWAGD